MGRAKEQRMSERKGARQAAKEKSKEIAKTSDSWMYILCVLLAGLVAPRLPDLLRSAVWGTPPEIVRSVWEKYDEDLLATSVRDLTELIHELHGHEGEFDDDLFHPEMSVFEVAREPRIFYLRNFLGPEEVELAEKAFRDPSMKQFTMDNGKGDVFAPNPLMASGREDARRLDKVLDKRIAALAGVPEDHVEVGYMTEKLPGFEFTQLHHDHGDQRKSQPFPTLQSMVIYLNENPAGLTTFPLARPWRPNRSWEQFVEAEALPELRRGQFRHLQPGDERPVVRRILQRHQALCTSPLRLVPRAGDAVWFFNYVNDSEDLRSIHGTCSVPTGTKLSLSKFILDGPDSFKQQHG